MLIAGCALGLSAGPMAAGAAGIASLNVQVGGVRSGGVLPGLFAFCIPAKTNHVALGPNQNPLIRWSKGPAKTASYAIIMVDTDAPTVATDVNKEGHVVSASLKRAPFYHWVLVDIPVGITQIPGGAASRGVTAHGKPAGPTKYGLTGINDYTGWFANNSKMAGNYGGYDGPCPPWNDAIPHHYHFQVYALNMPHLGLTGNFTGSVALAAIRGHELAKGELIGVYTLNPAVAKKMHVK